jgi:4-hydroxybenzoate polyprenyltransferase
VDFIKRFLQLILFGNIYVALGAVCLTQSTIIQLRLNDYLFSYSLLVFFSTLFIYNFQRIFYKFQKNNSLYSVRRKWIFENQLTIKFLTLTGFIGICVSFFFNDYKIVFYLSPLLILSLAYFLPFIKLRKNAWFKLITLVFVWVMVTAIVPILLNHSALITKSNLLHIATRLCFMIAICIPFDIRDLQIDSADKISTIPHIMGENKTRWLAVLFMFIYNFLIVMEFYFGIIDHAIFIGLLFSAVINTILVFLSSSKRNEYFYVAGIDGTMILQGLVLFVVKWIC